MTATRLFRPALFFVVKVLQCPQCGSTDIYYEAGMITGQKYHCNKCNYVGSFVIERDMPEP
jgi:transposase-like protein